MRHFIACMAVLAGTSAAHASGGLSCTAEDKDVKFIVESGVTRGMGGPVFNFRGTLDLLDAQVVKDLRKTEFAEQHLAQYWFDSGNLNLLLYREREGDKPHGYVELVIRTQPRGDEGVYDGQYELTVFDTTDDTSGEGKTLDYAGTVECMVE